jgi:plastocyanin
MRWLLGMLTTVLVLAACGGGSSTSSGTTATAGCRKASQGRVTIVAKDIAWDTACLQGTLAGELTIEVDNQDTGVNHDFHLKGAPGDPHTPLAHGPVVQHLQVALPAGTYEYVCDIHSNMAGELRIG